MIHLRNCLVLSEDGSLSPGSVTIKNGRIVSICYDDEEKASNNNDDDNDDDEDKEVVDCEGHILSAGFIDLQSK